MWASATLLALAGVVAPPPPPADVRAAMNEACQDCHADMDDDELMELPDGSTLPLLVDTERWEASAHGKVLACSDCHTTVVGDPHPPHGAASGRAYRVQASVTCRRCHYDYHTRQVDSVHYRQLSAGNPTAPTCADCHDAHGASPGEAPRSDVEKRCARCHTEIAQQYERSAHGRGLADPGGLHDTPVCTDCHGVHEIADPTLSAFHTRSWEICAGCHSDAERMARYGLNPNVVSTYLDDFHGLSNKLLAQGAGTPDRPLATCMDCHGVHDVERLSGRGDVAVVRSRVAGRCRVCHEEAPDELADAWLYHYPPTRESAPLVWGITWIYRIMIPLIMVGLVLHILLDLWRFRFSSRGEAA